jgi:hypothetical protein
MLVLASWDDQLRRAALRTLDTLDLSKNGLSAAAREVLASGAHLAHTRIVV